MLNQKLLSLLAHGDSQIQIEFDATTQTAIIESATSVIETEIIIKESIRDDLPVLFEEEAAKQLFLAVECAQAVKPLSDHQIHFCYSGSIQRQKGCCRLNRLYVHNKQFPGAVVI